MHVANSAKQNLKARGIDRIRCCVGEQLELAENAYLFLGSGDIQRLEGIVESLVEGGLKEWLMREFRATFAFSRVQDRSRSISLTIMVKDVEPPKPLRFSDGKILSVFNLLGFNLVICLLVFTLERLTFYCKIKCVGIVI